MLYNFFAEYIPSAIIFTLAIFVLVKLITVKTTGLKGAGHLFVESFGLYSEQFIRNTFHKHLQKYYKHSNKINSMFYVLIGVLLALYIFISII